MFQDVRSHIDAERRRVEEKRRKIEADADACRWNLDEQAVLNNNSVKFKRAGFKRLALTPAAVLDWLADLGQNMDCEPSTKDERLALADDLETAARVLRGEYE